jgi:hypothetical protein
MSKVIQHKLRDLRFVGGRFDEHKGWLDFDVLPELMTYKRLLVEIAKEEWRRRNPEKRSLPKGFEENIRLAFHKVAEGSCVIPVERFVDVQDEISGIQQEDEVDEAARIIDATIVAAQNDEPFPQNLPSSAIPIFGDWGKTLEPGEGIELSHNGNAVRPRFDSSVRERILTAYRKPYEDRISIEGEVRAAKLKKATEGGSFSILLDNGDVVGGVFDDDQEATITKALHEHRSIRVHIDGMGEFDGAGNLRRIVRVDRLEERSPGEERYDSSVPPIWETIAKIYADVPDEEWAKVPTDLAQNLDHYLYGAEKEDK